jgi:flagellar biosynthetic protein FliQ
MLVAALVVGLIVSIFQAATQINESTLQFVPKLVVMFLVLLLVGPWMIQYLMDYIQRLFESIPQLIG